MTQNSFNPYVGPRPFERISEDSARFFGRSQETEEIISLIFGHPVILVYAQSGAGKTSLFNASIAMKLEENGFDVLPLTRVGGGVPESVEIKEIENLYVFNALLKIESETNPTTLLSTTLSTFLETLPRTVNDEGQPRPRVIIFDQFEELFTYTPEHWREQRDNFFLQVVEALNADPLLRVVFLIREDFLAELDPYSRSLPERLRTRYRLERLGESAALRAIKDPLVNTQRKFAPGVAEELVKELLVMKTVDATGKTADIGGQYVEPVQLQVVCATLWSSLEPDCTEIEKTHLKNFNVNDALSNFYKSTIESAAKETGVAETELRNWFGKTLITPMGTRSTVFRGENKTGGIDNSAVDFLESRHIIRAEFRAGARWYELTHDRLVEPILTDNNTWISRNTNLLQQGAALWEERGRSDGLLLRGKELGEAEAWVKVNVDQLSPVEKTYLEACLKLKDQEKREQVRNRLTTLLAVVALIAMTFAFIQRNLAQRAREQAEMQKVQAEQNLTQMTQLLDNISGLIQGDKVAGVVGFSPVQQELFKEILPYQQYVIDNTSELENDWKIAQVHYRIGVAAEDQGDSVTAESEYKQAFEKAKQSATELSATTTVPDKLLIILSKSAVFYSWALMNHGSIDEAEEVLNEAKSFMGAYQEEKNADLIMSFAILENAFARLSYERFDSKIELEHQRKAVDLARKAVSLDNQDLGYQRTLAVYLRNLSNTNEPLMTVAESKQYAEEGCNIAKNVDQTPGSGSLTLSTVIDCLYDESLGGKPDENIKTLLMAKNRLDAVLQIDSSKIDLKLSRARVTLRLANIELDDKNNKELANEYFQTTLADFLDIVGSNNTLPVNAGSLRSLYLSMKRILDYEAERDNQSDNLTISLSNDIGKELNLKDTNVLELGTAEKIQIYNDIFKNINNSSFKDAPSMALIAADSSLRIGEFKRDEKPSESLLYLNRSIDSFKYSGILNDTTTFNEQFEWACRAYGQRLRLNYDAKNTEEVLADLENIKEICQPIFDKYQFDFYLLQHLTGSYMRAGELLFNEKRYEEAKPLLEYASYWGIKSSTELLARMYSEGLSVPVDNLKADELENLADMQSMKRFTITADFGNTTSPFHLYVYQKPADYPYKGIDDQVEWLEQARGGTIPDKDEVTEAFRKLQMIAEENNVSFPELVIVKTSSDTQGFTLKQRMS